MYSLEKYRGSSSRYTCPQCGQSNSFTRYVDERGEYLADNVGICGRLNKCRYHKPPREHFAEHGPKRSSEGSIDERLRSHVANGKLRPAVLRRFLRRSADAIPFRYLIETLKGYESDALVQFLLKTYPERRADVLDVLRMYYIGTYEGYTVFPKIDSSNLFRSAKLIKFNPNTGKRLRTSLAISSLQFHLKKRLLLPDEFETDKDSYFGDHLFERFSPKYIGIVEAEKTAIVASMFLSTHDGWLWLATGSKKFLKLDRLARIGEEHKFILYPDADGYVEWASIASEGRRLGIDVTVSDLIENRATEAEKQAGFDLADYLLGDCFSRSQRGLDA